MSDWLFVSKFIRIRNQHVPLGLCLLVNISQYCETIDKTQLVNISQYFETIDKTQLVNISQYCETIDSENVVWTCEVMPVY